jgi:hypothetical protein
MKIIFETLNSIVVDNLNLIQTQNSVNSKPKVNLHFFMGFSDEDEMDYGFEYSDEEQDDEDVAIENQYYNSKGIDYLPMQLHEFTFQKIIIVYLVFLINYF